MARTPLRLTSVSGVDWFKPLAALIVRHLFTAADGETYAIGRMLGVLLFLFGLAAPTVAAIYLAITTETTWAELWEGLERLGIYVGLLTGSVVALITLTNPTEPKAPPATTSRPAADDSGDARPVG